MSKIRYLSVKQILEEKQYPFSHGHLRSLLLKRYENDLWRAVRKIGGKICIREDLLDSWIESYKEEKK